MHAIDSPQESLDPSMYVSSLNGLTGAVTLAAGTNISLTPVGNTITIAASGGITGLTIGTTTITGGTNTRILYDNSGVLGEYVIGNLTDAGTDGITIGSGTGAVIGGGTTITQHVSDSTHNGYLSSTDWTTFNNKQSAFAGTTLQYVRGDGTLATLNTSVVPESGNLYFTGARVLATRITGFVSGAGTITSSDTVLSAIDKLDGNIGALVTGVSSVTGTVGKIAVAPTTGAVVVTISAAYVGQTSITTLGTIGTGTWQGTAIAPSFMTNMTSTVSGTVPTPPNDATKFLNGTGVFSVPAGSTGANPSASVGLTAVNGSASTWMRSDGAPALNVTISPTWTGVHTFTPAARSSGVASYFTINAPADTGITTATESIGINHVGATRTWVDGTVAVQREYLYQAPTYNKTTTAATFSKAATLTISAAPIAGTGVTITDGYALWLQSGTIQVDVSNTVTGTGTRIGGKYSKFGLGSPNNTTSATSAASAVELWDSNNTTAGVQMGVGNSNGGTSAYNGFYLNNDLASDGLVDHFVFLGQNSSTYSDTTFGTLFGVASLAYLQNTDAAIAYITSSASAGGHLFYDGGTATSNLILTVNKTSLTYTTAPLTVENSQSGTSYTFALADANSKAVTSTNSSAVTFTVPPNSSVAFPIGTKIDVIQLGTGKLTLAQGIGVTINSQNGNKAMATQYVGATLWKQGTNAWILLGNLIA